MRPLITNSIPFVDATRQHLALAALMLHFCMQSLPLFLSFSSCLLRSFSLIVFCLFYLTNVTHTPCALICRIYQHFDTFARDEKVTFFHIYCLHLYIYTETCCWIKVSVTVNGCMYCSLQQTLATCGRQSFECISLIKWLCLWPTIKCRKPMHFMMFVMLGNC